MSDQNEHEYVNSEEMEEEAPAAPAPRRGRPPKKAAKKQKRGKKTGVSKALQNGWDDHFGDDLEGIIKYARTYAPVVKDYDQLLALLKHRRKGWTMADERRVMKEWNENPLQDAKINAVSQNYIDAYITLWKTCNACLRETPDFLFSGHLRVQPNGGKYDEDGERIESPLPTVDFSARTQSLVSHPVFQGKVKVIQAVIAFAVAARTGDKREFPFSLGTLIDPRQLIKFDEKNKENKGRQHLRKLLEEAINETAREGNLSEALTSDVTYLLRTIGRRSIAENDKTPLTSQSGETIVYWATVQDITTILDAIQQHTREGVPVYRTPAFYKALKTDQRKQKDPPAAANWPELVKLSGYRQGYLRVIKGQDPQAEVEQQPDEPDGMLYIHEDQDQDDPEDQDQGGPENKEPDVPLDEEQEDQEDQDQEDQDQEDQDQEDQDQEDQDQEGPADEEQEDPEDEGQEDPEDEEQDVPLDEEQVDQEDQDQEGPEDEEQDVPLDGLSGDQHEDEQDDQQIDLFYDEDGEEDQEQNGPLDQEQGIPEDQELDDPLDGLFYNEDYDELDDRMDGLLNDEEQDEPRDMLMGGSPDLGNLTTPTNARGGKRAREASESETDGAAENSQPPSKKRQAVKSLREDEDWFASSLEDSKQSEIDWDALIDLIAARNGM